MSAFVNPAQDASPMPPDEIPATVPESGAVRESAGAQLSRRREERSMEVADVAGRLKFAKRQIEALEADDYARLPGATFVRGMIRSYAKLLECDPQPMLDAFEARQVSAAPATDPEPLSVPFPDGRAPSTRIYLALCLVLILLVGGVMYEWEFGLPSMLQAQPQAATGQVANEPASPPSNAVSPIAAPEQPPAATEPQSSPSTEVPAERSSPVTVPSTATEPRVAASTEAVAPTTPAMATGDRLVLQFDEESWVEVRDRTGKILALGLNPPGNSRLVEGRPPYAVVIGNASHVRLTYKGAPFDLKPFIRDDVARFSLN